ncbi:MAG: hypothetical protein KF895_03070 [Parvibaculum sp.]|nr:hypothetical protein [Parvibaculum sp.]
MTNLSELKAKYAALGAEIERLEAKPLPANDGPLTEAPGWRADWEDKGQDRARLVFWHEAKKWEPTKVWMSQIPGAIYFPPHLFDTIISEMGDSMGDLL